LVLSFFGMIKVSKAPISPAQVIDRVKTAGSGCVVSYIGLIRDSSHGKQVASVEYRDADGRAAARLEELAGEIQRRWPVNRVAIYHRTGKLKVGDINLVVAVSAAHRREALAAVRFAVDSFKNRLPTSKKETYVGLTLPRENSSRPPAR
jgi:molybdopterin synthase catalytic subunit